MVIDCNVDESDQGIEGIPLHYFKAIGEGDDFGLVAIDLKLRGRLDLVPWGDPEKAKAEELIHSRSIHTSSPQPARHPPLHTTRLTPPIQPHLLNTPSSAIMSP